LRSAAGVKLLDLPPRARQETAGHPRFDEPNPGWNAMDHSINLNHAERAAVRAARAAGDLMRRNFHLEKKINSTTQHDIKLELDVRCQSLIERTLGRAHPEIAFLGEEGAAGSADAEHRWVVDPIDGTVNFTYGIPHCCVSIALQSRPSAGRGKGAGAFADGYETWLGVVYDPFCDELWTAIRGKPARLNGQPIRVSRRRRLDEAIVSIGFSKGRAMLKRMLPVQNRLAHRVRKVRIMGAAALALTYVASGRFDGYIEAGIRLWDIAAGGLIVECAGGDFWHEPIAGKHRFRLIANNGRLRRELQRLL
jgi:myo-inositol-1(or 4)-monophosphatase